MGILCARPWSGYLFFHTVVTPGILWLLFTQKSLDLSGSWGLLLAVAGLNMREMKSLFHLLVTTDFTCGGPTSLDTPRWCLAAACSTFSRHFTSFSPEPALTSLTLCSAKSFCCLHLLPQFYLDCTFGSVW